MPKTFKESAKTVFGLFPDKTKAGSEQSNSGQDLKEQLDTYINDNIKQFDPKKSPLKVSAVIETTDNGNTWTTTLVPNEGGHEKEDIEVYLNNKKKQGGGTSKKTGKKRRKRGKSRRRRVSK